MSKKKKNELILANDAIEFQPDAIELANRRLPLWANSGVIWLFSIMVIGIVWASVSKVDKIVQTTGKVISDAPNITMMPVDRMIIKEVHVREGDVVEEGDILFTFDPTINEADYRNITSQIGKLQPLYNRLRMEFDGTEPAGDADFSRLWPQFAELDTSIKVSQTDIDLQRRLFEHRVAYQAARREYYEASIESTKNLITSLEDAIASTEYIMSGFDQIKVAYSDLFNRDGVSMVEYLQVLINHASQDSQLIQYRNQRATYSAQLASNIAEKQVMEADWLRQVGTELNEVEQQLLSARESLSKVLRYRDWYEIRSPRRAVVHELARTAPGSAVREAEPLITLIPLDVEHLIEIEIAAKDRADVMIGNQVAIKMTPYPFQVWGKLVGTVIMISEDSFTRQTPPSDAMQAMKGNTYYRAHVRVDSHLETDSGVPVMIKPGMEAQVDVRVGERRIITYILHPLIKMLDESARER